MWKQLGKYSAGTEQAGHSGNTTKASPAGGDEGITFCIRHNERDAACRPENSKWFAKVEAITVQNGNVLGPPKVQWKRMRVTDPQAQWVLPKYIWTRL